MTMLATAGAPRQRRWPHLAALAMLCWGLLDTNGVRAAGDAEPSGLDLLERCHLLEEVPAEAQEAGGQARDHGYCLGYTVGYVSGFAARDATGAAGRFCPPVQARIIDFVGAIREWLVQHPEGLETLGAVVALRAFQWEFPCPEETTREPRPAQ